MKTRTPKPSVNDFAAAAGRALLRAAKVARQTAKLHGTPIYISRNGKVVAVQP